MMHYSLLWVTDPWTTLTHNQDTTLRLAQEGHKLGITSYWTATDFMFDAPIDQLKVIPITTDFAATSVLIQASSFHQIHYRVDPPVDFNYISGIEKIIKHGADSSQILNPVELISKQSEKIPPKELTHLAPRMRVVKDEAQAHEAFVLFQNDARVVTKPLHLAQSIGVKQWTMPKTESEFLAIIRAETHESTEAILVEEFLSQIHLGEVRMWFAFGKFIAALKKYPKAGDFRVLIDEGSKVEAYTLSPHEEKIALEVGASLKKNGVALAAIDFIGGKICDYNLTSPGLLVQLEQVHGKNFAEMIIKELVNPDHETT